MQKTRFLKTIASAMAIVLLGGCARYTESTSENSNSVNPSEDNTMVEYQYDHELNVLDDNYRNYYEIFVYSFCDSNGDGIGDLNGISSKLDYIQNMGFNGIWLTPIMPSPSYHKYNVKDYYDIDPEYGTMEDFDNLVKQCHKRGIRLIIDFVMNHTSRENEWFKSAAESLEREPCGASKNEACLSDKLCLEHNPYVDYYYFSDEPANNSHPIGTHYYEGVFSEDMPELNLENEAVRKEFEKIADFWLEKGVDGFRLDAVKEYFSGNPDKNIEVLKWFTEHCKSVKSDCYIVGEVWENFASYSKYYASGIDSIFGYTMAQANGRIAKTLNMDGAQNSVTQFTKTCVTVEDTITDLNPDAIDAPFIGNHDNARDAGFFNYDSVKIKAAGGLLLTMTGSPFVYYGEEIGLTGNGKDENKRAPMIWDAAGTGVTKGPAAMEPQENHFASVEEQLTDPNSILNYYKRAIRIRNENPCIARGKTEPFDIEDDNIAAVKRKYNDDSIVIVYNYSEEEKTLTSELPLDTMEIRGYLTTDVTQTVTLDGGLKMPPYSIAFLTEKT